MSHKDYHFLTHDGWYIGGGRSLSTVNRAGLCSAGDGIQQAVDAEVEKHRV